MPGKNREAFRDPPRPDYEYDVRQLTKEYEKALRNVQNELNSLFLTDFQRAQILAVEANIKEIIEGLRKYGITWTERTITQAAKDGVANTLYALGLVESYEQAKKVAKFGRINQALVDAVIADTQSDLLAVTQNVERRVRSAVRQSAADIMRANMAAGINGTQTLFGELMKDLRKNLGSAINTGIIDAAGRRWKPQVYVNMLVRTKVLEAHKEATINEALSEGAQYGVISRHGAIDACRFWEGKIVALTPEAADKYPYIGHLPRREIFHPNCKHVVTPVRRPDRLPAEIQILNEV